MNLEQALEKIVELNDIIKDRDEQIQEEQKEEIIDIESSWNDFMTQW